MWWDLLGDDGVVAKVRMLSLLHVSFFDFACDSTFTLGTRSLARGSCQVSQPLKDVFVALILLFRGCCHLILLCKITFLGTHHDHGGARRSGP